MKYLNMFFDLLPGVLGILVQGVRDTNLLNPSKGPLDFEFSIRTDFTCGEVGIRGLRRSI